ncbi:ATP-dependent helicase [Marisediminicola senii]|uniref:ATP-dependent helicase n=1 Tax=Marisediminicola senii TaxID=2711233 RepID=UPI0013ED8144|nr:ATP-dependent helicase [Marisediminicola senii]
MTTAQSLLDGLDDEQRVAAEALLGPVCLLAGAGTGKTRAITHRIAYGVASGVYPPGRVMALTFTSRAAAELRGRLRELGAGGVAARTFHASALSQLGFFWPQVVGGSMPRILESKGRLIAHAAETLRLKLDTPTLRDLAAEIEWRKVSRLTLNQYATAAESRAMPSSLTVDRMVALHAAYERVKDERRQLDFEDVLLATAGMIETEPWVAQQVREQYRFFVVDEYQDVSPLQQALLELWLGDREDLCVVGDASQTIYSFAGASADNLLGFGSRYRNATVVRLEQNYRSTPAIVDTANRLMRDRAGSLTLRAATAAQGRPVEPTVISYRDDRSEARAVAGQIADRIAAGARPQDIAILYRVNAQGAVLEAALGDAGVRYQVRGGQRFFDLPEVKQAMMMLKGAAVANTVEPLFKTVSDVLRSLGWMQDAPDSRGAVRDRWESLNELMKLAEAATPGTTLRAFSDDLAQRAEGQHEPTMAAVTLATLHSAKGLEWNTVYLVGISEGLVPISYAKTLAAIDEERRLLYVGITRARQRLHLSWAEAQPQRSAVRRPSRFLEELRSRTPGAGARSRA